MNGHFEGFMFRGFLMLVASFMRCLEIIFIIGLYIFADDQIIFAYF